MTAVEIELDGPAHGNPFTDVDLTLFVKYAVARLAFRRNLWWSLAN
jgi:hypothetical protein